MELINVVYLGSSHGIPYGKVSILTVITCILPAGKTTYINFKLGLNVREG